MENTENLKSLDAKLESLSARLKQRVVIAEKRTRSVQLLATAICILGGGYMIWLYKTLTLELTPDRIVSVAYDRVQSGLPAVSEEAETQLRSMAPEVVSSLLLSVERAIPAFGSQATANYNAMVEASFEEITDFLAEAIKEIFTEHREMFAQIPADLSSHDIREISETLAVDLKHYMAAHGIDEPVLDTLHDKLVHINLQLERLRTGEHSLNESDRLERRFIELAIQLLEQATG